MRLFHALVAFAGAISIASAQTDRAAPPSPLALPSAPNAAELATAIDQSVEALLKLQEGPDIARPSQWPYEGVYRVGGQIPVGYRIGGTAIVVMALAQSPEYLKHERCVNAVARALTYLTSATTEPEMSTEKYAGGYDVRIWGDIEGTECLCRLKRLKLIPTELQDQVERAIKFYLDGILALEMPVTGGWNYARPAGRDTQGAPASFVTAAALQALFEARAAGYNIPNEPVERGLAVLEKARGAAGNIFYSGAATERSGVSNATPGAVGRMTLAETTLLLAGRGSPALVRGSVDAFITHWDWLNKRRAKSGTHEPPYMVAPYYFMFAHLHAAKAVEMLPTPERSEYRRRLNQLLFSVRDSDATWNDRVFRRSAGYGTAMALLAVTQPSLERAAWTPVVKSEEH
jgi:hypothetical protein